jgi:hypothetical protein
VRVRGWPRSPLQPLVPRGLRPKAVRPSTSHSRRSEPRPRLIARARVHHPTRPPTLPAQLPLCATDPGKRAYVPFKAHHAGQTNRRALGVENPREQPARARCEVRPPSQAHAAPAEGSLRGLRPERRRRTWRESITWTPPPSGSCSPRPSSR